MHGGAQGAGVAQLPELAHPAVVQFGLADRDGPHLEADHRGSSDQEFVRLHRAAAGAEGHQSAARRQGPYGRPEKVTADTVEDHVVRGAPAGVLVQDDLVGARPPDDRAARRLGLVGAADGGDHPGRSAGLGVLEGERAHRAGRRRDQDRLAGLPARGLVGTARHQPAADQRDRLHGGHAVRDPGRHGGVQDRELGVRVGEAQPGDTVPDAEDGDSRAHGDDLPGDLAAERDRLGALPHLAHGGQRHADRLDPDQHLPGSRLGSVDLLGEQHLGSAVDPSASSPSRAGSSAASRRAAGAWSPTRSPRRD